jgi:hypothetical protein
VRTELTYLAAMARLTDRYWRSNRLILRLCIAMCLLSMRRLAAIFRLSCRFLTINLAMVFLLSLTSLRVRGRVVRGARRSIAETGIRKLDAICLAHRGGVGHRTQYQHYAVTVSHTRNRQSIGLGLGDCVVGV